MASSSNPTAASYSITDKLRETPKLAIDRLPVLNAIFERLSLSCIEGLREYCNAPVTAFVNQLEIKPSWDLLEAFEDCVSVIFYSPEWDARILIGLERRFIFALLEAMYGGDGSEFPFEATRAYTLLETRVGRAVCENAARALEAAFAPISEITLNVEKVETALEFTSLGSTNVTTVNAQVLFQVLDHGGRMFIFIPQSALYPIRQKLERERTANPVASDPWWAKKMQSGVAQTEVRVKATMEGKSLTLADITRFHIGQTIELKATDKAIVLECAGQRLFKGKLGQLDGFFTVTIDSMINDQEDMIGDLLPVTVGSQSHS